MNEAQAYEIAGQILKGTEVFQPVHKGQQVADKIVAALLKASPAPRSDLAEGETRKLLLRVESYLLGWKTTKEAAHAQLRHDIHAALATPAPQTEQGEKCIGCGLNGSIIYCPPCEHYKGQRIDNFIEPHPGDVPCPDCTDHATRNTGG